MSTLPTRAMHSFLHVVCLCAIVAFDMTAASFLARFSRRAAASSTGILRVSIRCAGTTKVRAQTRPKRVCIAFQGRSDPSCVRAPLVLMIKRCPLSLHGCMLVPQQLGMDGSVSTVEIEWWMTSMGRGKQTRWKATSCTSCLAPAIRGRLSHAMQRKYMPWQTERHASLALRQGAAGEGRRRSLGCLESPPHRLSSPPRVRAVEAAAEAVAAASGALCQHVGRRSPRQPRQQRRRRPRQQHSNQNAKSQSHQEPAAWR